MRHKIVDKKRLSTGNWLYLEELKYSDRLGKTRTWEAVGRIGGRGAVAIAALLRPSNTIVLVRQFRPPTERYVIEFPAGLIDGDESPETTAVRELREETGLTGEVVDVSPPFLSSPGMSGETIAFVRMMVDESAEVNRRPITDFDDGEDIETFKVSFSGISDFLRMRHAAGDMIDAKLASFALHADFSSFLHSDCCANPCSAVL